MTKKTKEDYEPLDAVQEAMGVMGRWQIIICIALSLVNLPVAWQQLSYTFLALKTDVIDVTPNPYNVSSTNDTQWYCKVAANASTNETLEFHYKSDFEETIISQWDLVCDYKILSSFIQSFATMFGILVGNMIFGVMADRFGRKIPLIVAVVAQSLFGLLTSFAPWYSLFFILKFISSVATGGTMLISFVILMEIVGTKWRAPLSVLFHIPFLVGQLLSALIAYLTRNWSSFQLAVSIPPFLLISYYWIIPESPRWLLAVGKIEKARDVLNSAAKSNGIPQEKVTAAIRSHENNDVTANSKNEAKYNITHLFRTPNLRKISICIAFNWFALGMSYFGLSTAMGQFGGNAFKNVAWSAIAQFPAPLIVYFLISRVSRLKILMCGNLLASVCLLLTMFFKTSPVAMLVLGCVGICALAISFSTIYLYTCEVFPTIVRNNGLGMCSVVAKFGSIIEPFAKKDNILFSTILFGVCLFIATGLCFLLPETMDCELPETIEDGENFRKKKRTSEISEVAC